MPETDIPRRPTLICIGATKAGTSWLHQNLSHRDDVWASPIKELNMLTTRFDPTTAKWTNRYLKRRIEHLDATGGATALGTTEQNYQQFIADLLAHPRTDASWYDLVYRFAPLDQHCIDVSPSYASLPKLAADYIAQTCPHARFVYILRNPLERAKSHLKMQMSRRKSPPTSLEKWLQIAGQPRLWDGGTYAQNLPVWKSALNDRLLCLPFGLINSDSHGVLRAIEVFADLKSATYPAAAKKIHQTLKIEIPTDVVDYLTHRTVEDQKFLETEFDPDFCAAL